MIRTNQEHRQAKRRAQPHERTAPCPSSALSPPLRSRPPPTAPSAGRRSSRVTTRRLRGPARQHHRRRTPRDPLEQAWVRDVVDLIWDAVRLRRLKAALLTACAADGMQKVLRRPGRARPASTGSPTALGRARAHGGRAGRADPRCGRARHRSRDGADAAPAHRRDRAHRPHGRLRRGAPRRHPARDRPAGAASSPPACAAPPRRRSRTPSSRWWRPRGPERGRGSRGAPCRSRRVSTSPP